jgi:hypothetical protein
MGACETLHGGLRTFFFTCEMVTCIHNPDSGSGSGFMLYLRNLPAPGITYGKLGFFIRIFSARFTMSIHNCV